MKGQWIGSYEGNHSGHIIVNVDELPSCFKGVAYLRPENPQIPNTAAFFKTENKAKKIEIKRVELSPINPQTDDIDTWENIKKLFPSDLKVSKHAEANGHWNDTALSLSWKTEFGTTGSCKLQNSSAGEPSELIAKNMAWKEYKDFVSRMKRRCFLFRGQRKLWRLRTAYHRTGRADLVRYLNEDVKELYRHLSARTKHIFDLYNPQEAGAFYSLLQHHGYPTPFLDWTYSPYVAAFFAYRGISKDQAETSDSDQKVRIFVFDHENWATDWETIHKLAPSKLHLSIANFIAIENERMLPQQSVSIATNIDDVEWYIKSKEDELNKKYLSAIDLPVKERNDIVKELRYMGITAGSMFPGIDGSGEELRERLFET